MFVVIIDDLGGLWREYKLAKVGINAASYCKDNASWWDLGIIVCSMYWWTDGGGG